MKCPKCHHERSQVIDSRSMHGGSTKRRRRECENCGNRFSTTEVYGLHANDLPLLSSRLRKRGGQEEDFDSNKLRVSIDRACRRRKVDAAQAEEAFDQVLQAVRDRRGKPIDVDDLARWTFKALLQVDRMAATSYAASCMEWDTPEEFFRYTK